MIILSRFFFYCAVIAILFCKASYAGISAEELRSHLRDVYSPGVTLISNKILDDVNCERSLISISATDPITHDPAILEYVYYKPHQERFRTVVIATPIGGENIVDDHIAQGLCYYGSPVAILRSWNGDHEFSLSWKIHDRYVIRAVIALRHVLDSLNVEDVGLFGASFGGIYGSMAMSIDKRIHKAVLVAAGSPLYKIIARSEQQHLKKLRVERMKRLNLTPDAYEDILKKNVNVDAGILANPANSKNLFMIMAQYDSTVPSASQAELWRQWGRPNYLSIPATHVLAVISAGFSYRSRIVDFLQN